MIATLWRTAASLSVCLCAAVTPARAQRAVPFEKFAADFVRRHDAEPTDDLAAFLDAKFLHVRVGILEVYYPPGELAQKGRAEHLKSVLVGLVRLQREWVSWADPEGSEPAAADLLQRVFTELRPRALALEGGGELLGRLGVAAEAVAAADSFAREMENAAFFGDDRAGPVSAQRIVLAPDRRHFLEFCAFLGSVDEQNQAIFWQPSMPARAECWCPFPVELQVVAMEYASPAQAGDDFTSGFPMDTRERTGLQQHVVQCAAASMTRAYFAPGVAAAVESGLIQDLVIALYGENNARSGGDGKARSSGGLSMFVPGGRSEGGGIVPLSMDSDWRATKGGAYFIRELRRGQRGGAGFVLRTREASRTHPVPAPFFGPTPPTAPAEFTDDYAELLRAYRSGFAHWLHTAAAGPTKASTAKFAELLRACAGPDPIDFASVCVRVYGVPLTGPAGEDNLESRFVAWLRKR